MAEYGNNKTKTLRPSLDHGILFDFEWHPKKDVKDTNYDDIEVALTNVNGDDFQSGQDKIKVLDLPLLGSKKTWKTGKCLLFRHLLRNKQFKLPLHKLCYCQSKTCLEKYEGGYIEPQNISSVSEQ